MQSQPTRLRPLWRWVLLAVLLGLAVPVAWVGKHVFFPRTYDVVSIASLPYYQDPATLSEAWRLPVAQHYQRDLLFQSNGSVCGPSSLANVLRSLGDRQASQSSVLLGTGKCRSGMCFGGLTLDELAFLSERQRPGRVQILRNLSLAEFREHLKQTNDPSRRYIVNFHRGPLFRQGGGHFSPIGGYLADSDRVLVLDVNQSFKPWLVASERLYGAMDTVDEASGQKRGLLLIE